MEAFKILETRVQGEPAGLFARIVLNIYIEWDYEIHMQTHMVKADRWGKPPLTDDLRKKRSSNESFWLVGQPDVQVETIADGDGDSNQTGKIRVSVQGFDYYNTKTGGVESGNINNIALWMLDTDYDGRSLYPRQVFFPMANSKDGWSRLARNLHAEIDEELIEAYRGSVSLPFKPGKYNRIAVKIVDDRGIESLRIIAVMQAEVGA